ncbi:MAG: dockerin type I repeat-containing protein [Bacteroidaceae bacterium]|nr:dockerin type I repeat-containing protein [Bacteroidaceae bacterium]
MSRRLLNLCLAALFSVVSTAAWALSEVGGVYQIGSAADLKAFAELVNGGNAFANAVLTADIDKGADLTMIGRDGLDYQGCFDGQGHTITIDATNQASQGTAIFRNVGVKALIQNLKVQGTIRTSQKLAAGIAVWSSGTIRGCYTDIEVTSAVAGDATHAGIVAVAYNGTFIEDCLAKFVIKGATTQNCGGIIGWCDGRSQIINCLVISDGSEFDLGNGGSNNIGRNDGNLRVVDLDNYNQDIYNNRPTGASYNNYVTKQWGTNKATTVVAYDDLASGQICYQLNNDQSHINWVQKIGTDPFPVPAAFGSGRVYASRTTECDGKSLDAATYSNSGSDQSAKHQYDKFGICSVCGCYNYLGLERDFNDGYLLLKTAEDIDLAEGMNRLQEGGKFSLKMAADIEYTAEPGRFIFNNGNWFDGSFNGDGHELTIIMDITEDNASLFPNFSGTFENVIMHGSITTSGRYAGSITSHSRRGSVKVQNVFSDIDINPSYGGDNTSAGLIGVIEEKTIVDNTIYAGNINGNGESTECLAGFAGWSASQAYFTNCAFLGTLNGELGDSKTLSRNPSNITCENVYIANTYGYEDEAKATLIENLDDIENGALAYALNGNQGGVERFYQKIGEDPMPMPVKKEGALVYAVSDQYRCDGQPIGSGIAYANSPSGGGNIPDHKFSEGFCTVCGSLQEDFITPVDGWFEISTPAQLLWWSHYAAKHLDANAKLTANIDMDGYSDRWAQVGTEGKPFYGNFDGQFHTISNLIVDMPNSNGVGLISVMNSLPSKGFGGLTDEQARNAEGVYIKNVVLDESCSLLGRGYVALVGMTAPWAGHVNIKGVMMCGDVTANGGPNAAGVFGCVMSSSCHVTIDNCGMVGNVYGPKENGSFSGWLGDWAEVTNCFAVGSVEGIESNERYFARYGNSRVNDNIKNCYARYGNQEHVGIVSQEDFESGALAWKANGEQFRTGYWFQDLGEDMYPFPDPSHGTVIFAAGQYFSVASEDEFSDVADAIQTFEQEELDEVIATQALLDKFQETLEALFDAKTTDAFADVIDSVNVQKQAIEENAGVYQNYITKCEEVKKYLDDNQIEGSIRDALYAYLTEDEEPDENNPLGSYSFIIENHTATAAEIKAEMERVIKWQQDAIAEDYAPGTDVSNLIANGDFTEGRNEKWTDGWATGSGKVHADEAEYPEYNKTVGVEGWAVTGDMYQTLEGMKPGYYLVGTHAAYRPSNNRYGLNYAAGIYANGTFNFFPTVIEDYVAAADTIDQVNCNLHGDGAHDLEIYDDFMSTNADGGANLLGYAVQGPSGLAAAANVGRYQVYTIGKVEEDGKLTIGIKNPGSNYSNDWTGWTAIKLTYLGEQPTQGVADALENMKARANTIINDYVFSDGTEGGLEGVAYAPNYPEDVKEELYTILDSNDDDFTVISDLSDVFQKIYEGKQAYLAMYEAAHGLESVLNGNLALVEKDPETGEWYETGDLLFDGAETETIEEVAFNLYGIYADGTYSTEEALEAASNAYADAKGIVPAQDQEGNYLIGTAKELAAFRVLASEVDNTVKGKLTADIDMDGIAMLPICSNDYKFRGVFDGQGHALSNVYINNYDAECCALFYMMQDATVKNLKLTGDYYSSNKYIAGIVGKTFGNCVIDNCDVAITINSAIEGDGTHGGIIGVNEESGTVISNCLVNNAMYGETTTSCGGVCGWATNALTINNTLILSQDITISSESSNIVSRNDGNVTVNNVFYAKAWGGTKGVLATEAQLASGEIAYKMNGSKSEGDLKWFQTIGQDATPRLFDGAVVYFYGGKYMNDVPNPQLNAFAYNLDAKLAGNSVVVSFDLNAEAEAAEVRFFNGELQVYTQKVAGELRPGTHKVTVDASKLNGNPTSLAYEVVVTGKGSLDILKVGESYKFSSPYGLAVNNNPASKGFGQVLVTETRPTETLAEDMFSANAPGQLFALDAAFQPVGHFNGGFNFAEKAPLKLFGEYELGFKDVRFSQDGRLFVGNASGTTTSSVYELNPDDLSEAWKPVFTGGELDEATGITYVGNDEQNRPAVGLALEGEGDDLKMYVLGVQGGFDKSNDVSTYAPAFNCAVYELGSAKEWTAAPSAYVEALDGVYAGIPTHISIFEDRQGGLWFIQSATEHSEAVPSIKHFDAEGNEDYSDATTNTYSGMMAITTDGKYIAFGMGQNKVVLYETNYVPMANGMLWLEPKYNIATSENNITGLAFDFANNLYVASSGTKTLSRYTIPSWNNNIAVTPGNGIVEGGIEGDLNGDSKVDIADAVAVLEVMARDGNDPEADLNGDGKVDIADFVAVLEIMAKQ